MRLNAFYTSASRVLFLASGAVLALSGVWPDRGSAADPAPPARPVSFQKEVQPLLKAHCTECHNSVKHKGKLELTGFVVLVRGGADGKVVVPGDPDASALVKMTTGPDAEMPPSGPYLGSEDLSLLRRWIAEGARDDGPRDPSPTAVQSRPPNPGRVAPRRLTRFEYDNTVRDLLGASLRPGASLPEDGASHGFDRIADTLSTSPLHTQQYERAAEALVDELFGRASADPVRRRVLPCDLAGSGASGGGQECAERIVRDLAPRAWRRPVGDAEIAPFLALTRAPARFETTASWAKPDRGAQRETVLSRLELALQALLLSPDFLYSIERDPDPSRPDAHTLGSHELASRLSYFLWSTMPDDQLFEAARTHRLKDPAELSRQVHRMLDDPKAKALSADFLSQWLGLRRLATHTVNFQKVGRFSRPRQTQAVNTTGQGVNYQRAGRFRGQITSSMPIETVRFFEDFLADKRPVGEMLTAPFTYLDARLATLYGLPDGAKAALTEDTFARVSVAGLPRAGILTQPAILTLTSHPDRTSPTLRGQFVLDRILCEPPPPPPPGIADLEESQERPDETVREVLARHRRTPNCRVCHEEMDSIGLAFEQFDAIGRFRDKDQGTVIDPSGVLPGAVAFKGAQDLARILATGQRFERCLTKQLLIYAVGRGFESEDDAAAIARTADRARDAGASLRATVLAVVTSEPFRLRGGAR